MALSFEEVNVLGNLINDTYGKGSTNYGEADSTLGGYTQGGPGNSSSVVTKASLQGDLPCFTVFSIIFKTLKNKGFSGGGRYGHLFESDT